MFDGICIISRAQTIIIIKGNFKVLDKGKKIYGRA